MKRRKLEVVGTPVWKRMVDKNTRHLSPYRPSPLRPRWDVRSVPGTRGVGYAETKDSSDHTSSWDRTSTPTHPKTRCFGVSECRNRLWHPSSHVYKPYLKGVHYKISTRFSKDIPYVKTLKNSKVYLGIWSLTLSEIWRDLLRFLSPCFKRKQKLLSDKYRRIPSLWRSKVLNKYCLWE